MYQKLLLKMLDAQKNMRHDIMNDIQIISGYLQLNHPEKAMFYLKLAAQRMRFHQELGKIPLPLFRSFLTWAVSKLNFGGQEALEIDFNANWLVWRKEDAELVRLSMEFLHAMQSVLANVPFTCKIGFTGEPPVFTFLFTGVEEQMKVLCGFQPSSKKLVLDKQVIASDRFLMTVSKVVNASSR